MLKRPAKNPSMIGISGKMCSRRMIWSSYMTTSLCATLENLKCIRSGPMLLRKSLMEVQYAWPHWVGITFLCMSVKAIWSRTGMTLCLPNDYMARVSDLRKWDCRCVEGCDACIVATRGGWMGYKNVKKLAVETLNLENIALLPFMGASRFHLMQVFC